MTVICYRDGIMAADSATWSGEVMRGHVKKIIRTPLGALVAAAGVASACEAFRNWACTEGEANGWNDFEFDVEVDECDFEGLIIDTDGTVISFDHLGLPLAGMKSEFHAIGCGSDLAIGAMLNGASAEIAVMLCIENHAFVGGRIQIERLHPRNNSPLSSTVADDYPAAVSKWMAAESCASEGTAIQ